jgi:hypothetical protein
MNSPSEISVTSFNAFAQGAIILSRWPLMTHHLDTALTLLELCLDAAFLTILDKLE